MNKLYKFRKGFIETRDEGCRGCYELDYECCVLLERKDHKLCPCRVCLVKVICAVRCKPLLEFTRAIYGSISEVNK